jgi:hypothetical protein
VLAQARCSLCGEAYTVVGAARATGVVEDAVEGELIAKQDFWGRSNAGDVVDPSSIRGRGVGYAEVAYKRKKMTYDVAGACGCA